MSDNLKAGAHGQPEGQGPQERSWASGREPAKTLCLAIEPQFRICWRVARGLAYAQAKPPWSIPETCTRMRSPAILSRARPRQGRVWSNASNSSTSLARKAAMSPMSLDSISTGRTACGAMVGGTSVGRAPLSLSVPTSARLFHAADAAAGVGFVGPMAPQCMFSQTTQQLPCTAWLTKTSSLPQNGQGNSSLMWICPLHLTVASVPTRPPHRVPSRVCVPCVGRSAGPLLLERIPGQLY